MQSTDTHEHLVRCRVIVADADISDELRLLGRNLLDHLIEMNEAQRLCAPVFLVALDSLELVPGLEDGMAALRATVNRQSAIGNRQSAIGNRKSDLQPSSTSDVGTDGRTTLTLSSAEVAMACCRDRAN